MLTKKYGQKMCVNKKILVVQNIYDLIYIWKKSQADLRLKMQQTNK